MSRHNYTNPAFCQQSEFYPNASDGTNRDTLMKMQRSESMRSFSRMKRSNNIQQMSVKSVDQQSQQDRRQRIQQRVLPPKPGPKPSSSANQKCSQNRFAQTKSQSKIVSEGYALVPLEELPNASKGRYAVLPVNEAHMMRNSSMRLTKSQDNLDCVSTDTTSEFGYEEEEDSFTSLPPALIQPQDGTRKLVSAFSTDFINKSMILVDQTSMQRYAIVPTDDDEEVVDSNHEIIQMHNGRAHRYAVIPTDEEETCLSGEFETTSRNNYDQIRNSSLPVGFATPPKPKPFAASNTANRVTACEQMQMAQQTKTQMLRKPESRVVKQPATPTKNPIATQKLHELLSTPRKTHTESLQRHGSYQTIIHKSPNQQYRSQIICSTPKQSEFTPQKLQYDSRKMSTQLEQRTTAIISPRLQQSIYNDTTSSSNLDKTWTHESFHKVENATATIAVISLMLLLTGVMNSGLCLYMVTDVSKIHTIYPFLISILLINISSLDATIIFP